MKRAFAMLGALLWLLWIATSINFAAEQTTMGVISDSICGASHAALVAQLFPPPSDAECAKQCIASKSAYVLVDDGTKKVLKITNQGFADLKDHIGQKVKVTGELKNDTISVSKIEAAEPSR